MPPVVSYRVYRAIMFNICVTPFDIFALFFFIVPGDESYLELSVDNTCNRYNRLLIKRATRHFALSQLCICNGSNYYFPYKILLGLILSKFPANPSE